MSWKDTYWFVDMVYARSFQRLANPNATRRPSTLVQVGRPRSLSVLASPGRQKVCFNKQSAGIRHRARFDGSGVGQIKGLGGNVGAFSLLITTAFSPMASFATSAAAQCDGKEKFDILNWNIAAINNNPFEYWISYDNDAYNNLMDDVQEFINNPGENDVRVSEVFTDSMFNDLKVLMEKHGWTGLEETENQWKSEYRNRKIISEFIKDGEIGNKRLASMPDRVTNTINLVDGTQAFRPTAINCYQGEFSSFDDWWAQWKNFMFVNPITLKLKGEEKTIHAADLLLPIKKAKYPAITESEEAISLPLQTLCGGIFDAILIHMLNKVSPSSWQVLRKDISNALNLKKNDRTLEILENTYGNVDIMFLQEVANSFVSKVESNTALSERYMVISPVTSGKRDQNSIILVKKSIFDTASIKDVTPMVEKKFEGKKVPVAEGDIVAATITSKSSGDSFLLASFHGDTNGLATIPVLDAIHEVAQSDLGGRDSLIFGLDANTYEHAKPGKTQCVTEFAKYFVEKGFTSNWGDEPIPSDYTTFNARTFLQPQLNKASTKDEFFKKGDVNPKDFILFYKSQFAAAQKTKKDNTGKIEYIENMVFPTLTFPSDHAVISTRVAKL